MNDFNNPDTIRIPVNDSTREGLISTYAQAIVEDMDMKCLMQMAVETITNNLTSYTNEELEEEMIDNYDYLLEEKVQ
jgi:hypothetical protein